MPHAACCKEASKSASKAKTMPKGDAKTKPKTYFARPAMSFDDRQSTDGRVRERDKEREGRRERGRER